MCLYVYVYVSVYDYKIPNRSSTQAAAVLILTDVWLAIDEFKKAKATLSGL